MSSHTAFFYGTLMAPQVLHRVCYGTPDPLPYQKALLTITPAILHNHSRHKVRHCDYPAVIPNPSTPSSPTSTVRGTLVTGLTDGDIWRLDTFEGSEYERQKVKVKPLRVVGNDITGEGDVEDQEVETETYIWTSGRDELEDGEWDFETFVKEKLRNWVGGSEEYAEVDAAVGATEGVDPTGGRGTNGRITDALEEMGEKGEEVMESAV